MFLPSKFVLNFCFSVFSVHATIAAAVVNEPAGSGKTEISNGGTIAFFAASIMSKARDASFPHIKIPVFLAFDTDLEKIASCTKALTSVRFTLVYGITRSYPASHAILTSNGLTFSCGLIICKIFFLVIYNPYCFNFSFIPSLNYTKINTFYFF